MDLISALKIEQNDVVSVVGAGGKTSLIKLLALNTSGRNIIMPSTKFEKMPDQWPCFIDEPIRWTLDNQVIVTAKEDLGHKLSGSNPHVYSCGYDHLYIEADGSRRLSLKGWADKEPVIEDETTVTIGIISIKALGLPVDEEHIFRIEAFCALTNTGNRVSLENLRDIILHPKGLFQHSVGRRILIINQAEDPKHIESASLLRQVIENSQPTYPLDRIIVGSILSNTCLD